MGPYFLFTTTRDSPRGGPGRQRTNNWVAVSLGPDTAGGGVMAASFCLLLANGRGTDERNQRLCRNKRQLADRRLKFAQDLREGTGERRVIFEPWSLRIVWGIPGPG